jgi:hypothetical protein
MKIEFDIPDEKVRDLNINGKVELTKHCKGWAEEIIDEAARIEGSRNTGANAEITASIVAEAAKFSKKSGFRRRKRGWLIFLQLVSFFSSLWAGSLLDSDKFNNSGHVFLLLGIMSVSVASTVTLTIINEQNA